MLPEDQHVLSVIKTTMRVLGYNNRDVERQLDLSGSYLSRLFSGDIDLRYSHIVDIARAMGLEPEEILLLAYPPIPGPKSEAAQRLWAIRAPLESPDEAMGRPARRSGEQEMEEAAERVVVGMLEKLGPLALLAGRSVEEAAWVEPTVKPAARPRGRKRNPERVKRPKKSKV